MKSKNVYAEKGIATIKYLCLLLPVVVGIAFYVHSQTNSEKAYEHHSMQSVQEHGAQLNQILPEDRSSKKTIIVSFSSVYEADYVSLLENMYQTARYPENVFVGAVCLFEETASEPKSWIAVCQNVTQFCPRPNIRRKFESLGMVSGPSDAHFLSRDMYRGESFVLFVHDNIAFVSGWDSLLFDRHRQAMAIAQHPQVILSHPIPRWLVYSQKEMDSFGKVCIWNHATMNDFGYIDVNDNIVSESGTPFQHYYASDQFLFAPSQAIGEVQRDPNIKFLYQGGDLLYSSRLWTSGWDMYHPGISLCFKKCAYREFKAWSCVDKTWKVLRKGSINRLQRILFLNETAFAVHTDEEKMYMELLARRQQHQYAIGKTRSLKSFWENLHKQVHIL